MSEPMEPGYTPRAAGKSSDERSAAWGSRLASGGPRVATGAANMRRRDALLSAGGLLAASTVAPTSVWSQTATKPDPGSKSTIPLHRGMLAFMLAHEQFRLPELLKLGAEAEQAGFDMLATSDHFQPWQANEQHSGQAWVTLGALGQKTRSVWMGPTVTCPTLRYNPAVVAEAYASLSNLTPGRIFLGLGSGEALNEQAATGQWPAWRERWDRLIEAVEIIRKLWTGEPLEHKGAHYTVKARLYDPPAHPIPLLLAANGPKAIRLAGQHGDGLVTDPQTWKMHKADWQAAAKAAGKNPDNMPVLIEQFVVVGDENDAKVAARLWNFIPKAFKGYHNIPDPAEIERRAKADLPLEKVYGDWTVSTDPKVHIEAVRKLFDGGATIVNIHSGQPDQSKVLQFYGKNVVPEIKKAVSAGS
jgi:TAT-translocated FGD2 family F420-dependent dehydrogenase